MVILLVCFFLFTSPLKQKQEPRAGTGVRRRKRLSYCPSPVAYGSSFRNILTRKMGLPHFAKGEVVKGFGRGSKELGCPTANFPVDVVRELPTDLDTGVYFGFASVDRGDVHKMVMSIGWNPFYKNNMKSMETHILHDFESDFYGKELRVVMLGYLRPEKKFGSLEELIAAIQQDIKNASEKLDESVFSGYKTHSFFTE